MRRQLAWPAGQLDLPPINFSNASKFSHINMLPVFGELHFVGLIIAEERGMSKTSIFKLIIVIFISSISLQESSAAGEGRFKTAAKKLQNMISHTGQALTTPRKLRKSAAGIGLRRELARIEPSKQENDWSKQSYLVNSRHGSSNCCRPSGYVEFANYRWTLLKSLDSNTHLYYSRFGQLRKLVGSNTGTTIAGLKRLWPRDYGKYDLSFDTVNKLATHNLNVFENGGIPIIQTEERIVLPPPM